MWVWLKYLLPVTLKGVSTTGPGTQLKFLQIIWLDTDPYAV